MAETPAALRWTIADLEVLPDDEWKRYEIVDGELFVAHAPGNRHQRVCNESEFALTEWNHRARLGVVLPGPGLIFGQSDSVIPDIVWVSHERFARIQGDDDHLHGAPELVIEVLSPGATNERRDREAKLKLYSTQGVDEYWIVDWRTQTVAVYRRRDAQLQLVATLHRDDTLTSPILPGFAVPVAQLFQDS
jgi:Uma2 family endonuclease